nr:unnamed protein product [Callosobruchus analis]
MEPQIMADVPLESSVSAEEETLQANLSGEPTPSTSMIILPEVIRPYPKSGPRKPIRKGRQPRKTKILTETTEKTGNGNENKKIKVIATQTNKREKQHKTKKFLGGVKTKISKSKKCSVKRRVLQSSSDSDTDAEDSDYLCHDSSDSPLEKHQDENSSWFSFVCEADEMLDMRLCVSCLVLYLYFQSFD